MKVRKNFLTFKGLLLNLALTASAFSNQFQSTDASKNTVSMTRARRRFGDFDDVEILHAAKVSKSVYFWQDDAKLYTVHDQYLDNEFDTFYSITEDDNGRIFVSFRGTDNVKNVLVDLWCNWAHFKKTDAFYHNGALKAYESIHDQLKQSLELLSQKKGKSLNQLLFDHVFFVGHSLGGGMALLATDFFLKEYHTKVRTICFATPMVMDERSAHHLTNIFGERILNIQQDYDPIPHVMDFGFHPCGHVGHIIKIPHFGGIMTIANVHRIHNYIEVLSSYILDQMPMDDSYFQLMKPKVDPQKASACIIRQYIHKTVVDTAQAAKKITEENSKEHFYKLYQWLNRPFFNNN